MGVTAEIKSFSKEFDELLGDNPRWHNLVEDGTNFHEGPVYVQTENSDEGDYILYSTVGDKLEIRKFDIESQKVSTYRSHSEANMPNGHVLDSCGRLLTCEQGDMDNPARITRTDLATGKVEVLLDHGGHVDGEAVHLNSPNDIVEKSDGSIWFTDPSYGHLQGFRPPPHEARQNDPIYRLDPKSGEVTVVDATCMKPNGLAFSPDEARLYVTDTGAQWGPDDEMDHARPHHILCYDVVDGCRLENKREVAAVQEGIPDGMKLDEFENIFVGTDIGVQVFSKEGKELGRLDISGGCTQLTFEKSVCSGNGRGSIYICAEDALLKLELGIAKPAKNH